VNFYPDLPAARQLLRTNGTGWRSPALQGDKARAVGYSCLSVTRLTGICRVKQETSKLKIATSIKLFCICYNFHASGQFFGGAPPGQHGSHHSIRLVFLPYRVFSG
jgi:hypothetical protein